MKTLIILIASLIMASESYAFSKSERTFLLGLGTGAVVAYALESRERVHHYDDRRHARRVHGKHHHGYDRHYSRHHRKHHNHHTKRHHRHYEKIAFNRENRPYHR